MAASTPWLTFKSLLRAGSHSQALSAQFPLASMTVPKRKRSKSSPKRSVSSASIPKTLSPKTQGCLIGRMPITPGTSCTCVAGLAAVLGIAVAAP